MVGLQLNALDASPNIVINQTLMGADGTLHTNKDGILLSSTGFSELFITIAGFGNDFEHKEMHTCQCK